MFDVLISVKKKENWEQVQRLQLSKLEPMRAPPTTATCLYSSRACRPTGIHVCKPCSSIRLACDMPYFSARGFVGSVIFHTPLGKWVTLEQNMLPVAASYKEEERQRCLARPTQWPLRTTVKWFTHLTNASMWKVFFQPWVFSLVSINSDQDVCPHTPRGQKRNIKHIVDSLLGHPFFGCL